MPNLTINGTTYPFPDIGTKPWAAKVVAWATAVTSGMLQKAGGTFTLTAEIDFGATYGLKTAYYKSRGTNPAASGVLRLANAEVIAWRNAANGADLSLVANASDELIFNSKKVLPLTTDGDLYLRSGGDNARLAKGADGTVLGMVSGAPAWTSVAGTGDVVGPGSSVDNTLPRFDSTSGKAIQTSGVVLDDNDALSKVNFKRVAKSASGSTAGEVIVGVTDTSAARTITLENDDKVAGRVVIVKDESGGAMAYPITIQPESGTIDGAASVQVKQNYGSKIFYSDGSNWFSVGGEDVANPVPTRYTTASGTNETVVKASPGKVFSIDVYNSSDNTFWLHLYDKATAPGGGDTPVWSRFFWRHLGSSSPPMDGGAGNTLVFPDGIYFANGISFATSSVTAGGYINIAYE